MRSQREARSAASTAAMAALRAAAGKLRPRKAASRAASTKYMYTIIMLRGRFCVRVQVKVFNYG